MRRILTLAMISAMTLPAIDAQTFFSVNAGTDGFNFNVTNAPPLFPAVMVAPPPAPVPVCVPLRPGVEYYPVVSPKRYKKAMKRYRKAMRHASPAIGVSLPGGIVFGTAPAYYYDDDDDDDYEDWLEDQYKHYKKRYKHYKKHHKHHKHHHWDDD